LVAEVTVLGAVEEAEEGATGGAGAEDEGGSA